jgi:hypothetical protein
LNKIIDESKIYGIINFSQQVILRNKLIQGKACRPVAYGNLSTG